MKKSLLLSFAVVIVLLFVTCDRDWDNPFHDKNTLDPEAWAPENLQVETVSITERKLTWSYNGHPNIEGFKIDRKKGDEPWQARYQAFAKEERSWNDTDITPDPNLNYQYRLYAFAGNNSSAQKSANTNADFPPPTDLTSSRNTMTSVTLNWQDNSTGEEGFKIERKYENGDWAELVTTTGTSWQDNEFELNKMVYYRVNAYYDQYISGWVENTFDANIPPPENLTITANSVTALTLIWSYNLTGHEGFKIDKKVDIDDWEIGFSVISAGTDTFHDNSVNLLEHSCYYRVYAYVDEFTSIKSASQHNQIQLGSMIFGGIVFYIDSNGGGLVCTESDKSSAAEWGCYGTAIGVTSTGVGTGAANTAAIVAGCSQQGVAVRICRNLVLNGYSDWFLPSRDELNLMHQNLKLNSVGGFADGYYWSSSESNSNNAWVQLYITGDYYSTSKTSLGRVRAVRAF